jgi:iron complex transport system substrate-binding protein|tara:strand:- start:1545 stop:2324 length:780 start_codon:yes stop_codon:yes gene_type:complete
MSRSKIVVAGGSITEIVYFLGMEDKLVGVDITSNFPKKAKKLKSIGYLRNLSIEGILSLRPGLVLAEEDIGPPIIVNQLRKTSIDLRIIKEKNNLNGIRNKIMCISKILNTSLDENEDYVKLQNKLHMVRKLKKINSKKIKRILLILMMRGSSPVVAGKNTSGQGFIDMIGHENSMHDLNGWKPVSSEEIIKNNPDYIIITKRAFKNFASLDQFVSIPGISSTLAAKKKNIIVKDGMSMLGFGPRTINVALDIDKKIGD